MITIVGRDVSTRIIRNNAEIAFIGENKFFNPNYQYFTAFNASFELRLKK